MSDATYHLILDQVIFAVVALIVVGLCFYFESAETKKVRQTMLRQAEKRALFTQRYGMGQEKLRAFLDEWGQ